MGLGTFCSGLGNWCREQFYAPLTRTRLMVYGGILLVLIIVIIILSVSLSGSSSKPSPTETGSDALRRSPLIIGSDNLAENIKKILNNKINGENFTQTMSNCNKFCQTDFDGITKGLVSTMIWVVNTECQDPCKDYVQSTLEGIDIIHRLVKTNGHTMSSSSKEIQQNMSSSLRKLAMIGIRGAHNIDSRLSMLRIYKSLGVIYISIIDNKSTCVEKNLIPWYYEEAFNSKDTAKIVQNAFLKQVMKEMKRLGMLVDLSGLKADDAEALLKDNDINGTFIFSRSNALSVQNHKLNIADSTLKLVKEKRALVMVSFNAEQTYSESGNSTKLIEHINKIVELAGIDSVAIGTDFDSFNTPITGLENLSKIPDFFDLLKKDKKGKWSMDDLKKLAGQNFINILKRAEDNAKTVKDVTEGAEDKVDFENLNKNLTTCRTDIA